MSENSSRVFNPKSSEGRVGEQQLGLHRARVWIEFDGTKPLRGPAMGFKPERGGLGGKRWGWEKQWKAAELVCGERMRVFEAVRGERIWGKRGLEAP